jgi:hypothetical protein
MFSVSFRRINTKNIETINVPYPNIISWNIQQNKYGSLKATLKITGSISLLSFFYENDYVLDVQFFWRGILIWRGRTEAVKLTPTTVEITALGYIRLFAERKTFSFYSSTDLTQFFVVDPTIIGGTNTPFKYNVNISDSSLYFSLKKNISYNNSANPIYLAFKLPQRLIDVPARVQFKVTFNLPNNWVLQLNSINSGFATIATEFTTTATGVPTTICYCDNLNPNVYTIMFFIFNNTGGVYNNTLDDDVWFVRITDFRLITTSGRNVDTTLTNSVNPGSPATFPVASTANIYVGQKLTIASNTTASEIVTVLSVTGSSFTANNTTFKPNGSTVRSASMYADDIIKKLISDASNSTPLQSNIVNILPNNLDVFNLITYGDNVLNVIETLTTQGGNSNSNWNFYIDNTITAHFKPISALNTRNFILYINDFNIQRLLETLTAYSIVIFKTTYGAQHRTFSKANPNLPLFGSGKTNVIKIDSTSQAEAEQVRELDLINNGLIKAQTSIQIEFMLLNSIKADIFDPQPYDTCTIANLPLSASPVINSVKTFRISEVHVDSSGTIKLIPDLPIPGLEFLQTRQSFG